MRVRIDTTNFMRAQAVWQAHSRRSRAENLNRAVGMVVRNAYNATKVTPQGLIDSELMVTSNPKVLKNGQLSQSKKRTIGSVMPHTYNFEAGKSKPPLAALIVNARVLRVDTKRSQPGMSRYNRLTGLRYAILQSPFKGVSRRTGAAKMTAAITRMVKSRHSSAGFLKASWIGLIKALTGRGRPATDKLSRATPATPHSANPICVIENRVGMEGESAVLNERRNIAAHTILAPILQRATDAEFHRSLQEFDRRGYKEAAPLLAKYGFKVTA